MSQAKGVVRRLTIAAALAAFATLAFGAGSASAGFGDLSFGSCIDVGGADCGNNGEVNGPRDIVLSPDGKNAYTTSTVDDLVSQYARNPVTGQLTYQTCYEDSASDNCGINDVPKLNTPNAIAISPDGQSLYVTSGTHDSVLEFARDPVTGNLNFDVNGSCLDDNDTQTGGGSGCPDAPGLTQAADVTVSPDGESVYVTSLTDNAIVAFDRDNDGDQGTGSLGALTYMECIVDSAASETDCATVLGPAQGNPELPNDIIVSPGGTSVYVADQIRDQIVIFDRIAMGMSTGDLNTPRCIEDVGGVLCFNETDGLDEVASLAIATTAGGTDSVYSYSTADDAVVRFDRTVGGDLDPRFCFEDDDDAMNECLEVDGLSLSADPDSPLAIPPDGRSLYVSANDDNAVTHFLRNPADGSIEWAQCFGDSDDPVDTCAPVASEMLNPDGLAFSSNSNLHQATQNEDAVNTFNRELDPPAPGPGVATPPPTTPAGPTGQRAAALKKCAKIKNKKKKKKCKKRARKLPV